MLHRLVRGFAAGTHEHDDAFRVRRANIFKQICRRARCAAKFVHHLLHDVRAGGVKRIGRLAALEERVGILRRAAQHRPVRRQAAGADFSDQLVVNQRPHDVFVQQFNLGNLVRRAEAVEEMDERQARAQGGGLGNEREIHRLLHGGRAEHRPAGRAAGHDVAVVAEDGKRMGGHRAGGDVKDRRQQFARDLEHVGNHQQQPLRRREGGGDGTGLQHAVDRAHRAAFALHFDDGWNGAPEIFFAFGRPLIAPLGNG
jgi:hypothetical protein